MKRKNKKSLNIKPVALLAAAAVLLLASTVGSTQAALTYYSDNYSAEVTVSNIGVTLLENGTEISRRNYIGKSENQLWDEATGTLMNNLLAEDEVFKIGKAYTEEISVKNSGAIDSYVRVVLRKSWQDENGNKNTGLSPELIQLQTVTGNGWVEDTNASTDERIVLYYTNVLKAGETSPICTDTISIDSAIGTKVTETREEVDGGTKITYTYVYNGYTFNVEAEVDAVQTHNAKDAIKSAWGVDVAVAADGTLSLK